MPIVCDMSEIGGETPVRKRVLCRLSPEERDYFARKADEFGCREVLRCLRDPQEEQGAHSDEA